VITEKDEEDLCGQIERPANEFFPVDLL